jgi:hypothetical protein
MDLERVIVTFDDPVEATRHYEHEGQISIYGAYLNPAAPAPTSTLAVWAEDAHGGNERMLGWFNPRTDRWVDGMDGSEFALLTVTASSGA